MIQYIKKMTNVRRNRGNKCRSKVLEKVSKKGTQDTTGATEGSRDNSSAVTEGETKGMVGQMQIWWEDAFLP